jgi:hypothetical protein
MTSKPDDLGGWAVPVAPALLEPSRAPQPLRALIVSNNSETLDGLQDYLQRAGVDAHGTSELASRAFEGAGVSAAIVFPDDFERSGVVELVDHLERGPRRVPCLLVTRDPLGFESLLSARGIDGVTVIAKPAWGWTILDALRATVAT